MPALRHGRIGLVPFLALAMLPFAAFHAWLGPEPLQYSHIQLGRSILYGESVTTPAHPKFG